MNCDTLEKESQVIKENSLDLPDGVPYLRSLYLYMTSGCNLCCKHCWINPSYESGRPAPGEYINLEQLKLAVPVAKTLGLTQAKLTGGEPLLHPQFIDIVDYLTTQELSLTMETNGTLFSRDIAFHLKTNTRMWHISVSLDSPRAEYHDKFRGVAGAFDNTIRGIKHLVDVGFKPQVIMCPHQQNLHEISELVNLAVELGVGSVKFNPISGIGRGKAMKEGGSGLNLDEVMTLTDYINNELQPHCSIPLICLLPPALNSIDRLLQARNLGGTCGVLNVLGILGSGEMALCGIGRTVRELCFGSLEKDDLKDVWVSHPKLLELRTGMAGKYPGVCGNCIHSSRCLMHCIALNYVENGAVISPDPMCTEADLRGFFPNSRRRVTTEKAVVANILK